jgi:probable rRNA maturation factor
MSGPTERGAGRARPRRSSARKPRPSARRRTGGASPRIAVLVEAPAWQRRIRNVATLARRAARAAVAADPPRERVELCLVLADNRAVRRLNREWRGRDKPTNVLSFPARDAGAAAIRLPKGARSPLGDVIVACGVAASEAAAQGKTLSAHLSHLVVHGVLHLLGYDHERDAEAERMEALERRVLRRLGYADPYRTAS